ncbi:MAG: LptF/LptG family permease [Croceibacterium sp.]
MRSPLSTLDRYLLANVAGTLGSVFGIVIALLMFEHLPRLFDIVRLSGRKAYVVVESMISLLPEYAGIGLLFGLYLAIALTVRRLSLRDELDVIEATGVSRRRWMRTPVLTAALVAGLLLWTEGWLMPAGERRIDNLSHRMLGGAFGYDLERGQFTDLGKGVAIKFDRIEPSAGGLGGVFVRNGATTFAARHGRLAFDFRGNLLVELAEGLSLNRATGQALSFARFKLVTGGPTKGAAPSPPDERKLESLPSLLGSGKPADSAAGWSRLLWPVFALLIPMLAVVLGKPAQRTSHTTGLMSGLVLLVLFIRTAGMVETTRLVHPAVLAIAVALGWAAVVALLVRGERHWGAGYVDVALRRIVRSLARREAQPDKEKRSSTEDRSAPRRQVAETAGDNSWMLRAHGRSSTIPIGEPMAHAAQLSSATI